MSNCYGDYEQLDLITLLEQSIEEELLSIGKSVKAREPKDTDDVETFYYLKRLQDKKGTIIGVERKSKIAYYVEFPGLARLAILERKDLIVM